MKWFKAILIIVLIFGTGAAAYAQDPGMMSSGQGKKARQYAENAGARIFILNCSRCHPNGGNVIMPDLPLRGSLKLVDFKTFLSFIRDPKMPDGSEGVMPVFRNKKISDRQAKELYQYIVSAGESGTRSGGNGMMGNGMMGNGMMGNGMMGNGMMGRGMMGGYDQSAECRKFLDETAGLRKELYDKRFEYYEANRNPKTTVETLIKLEREIFDLQRRIYAKAPLGCSW